MVFFHGATPWILRGVRFGRDFLQVLCVLARGEGDRSQESEKNRPLITQMDTDRA